ncbi:MAG: RsmE family RNA methyltransferase [Elusimicrobia bacterium]|nr:RsmE family RNA methyltransferase [Elusimicrobiota bacterium]
MPQYLISPQSLTDKTFFFEGPQAHHAVSVMRHKVGGQIYLFDGQGNKYLAKIERVGSNAVSGAVLEKIVYPPPKVKITLCFALVSRAAVETIIDQCTQAGVWEFQPVIAERTAQGLDKNWENKINRLKEIAVSACKQCGNCFIPKINLPLKLSEIKNVDVPALVAMEKCPAQTVTAAMGKLRNPAELKIFIGPEGGFTDDEYLSLTQAGAIAVTLGANVLRAETACLAACALVLQ